MCSPFIPNLDEPTAANNTNEPYLNYYQYLLAQPNSALPNVISNSYGDDEQVGFLDVLNDWRLLIKSFWRPCQKIMQSVYVT